MMDSSEGTSEFLKQLAEKKNSLRKAILMLMLESKDLDEHLDLTKECFNECVIDLKSKRKDLESDRDSIVESNKELDVVRESLKSRMKEIKEIENRGHKFCSFQKTQLEEFKRKEGQLEEIRMWVVGKMQVVELKEERLDEQKKSVEVLLDKFQVEKQEFEDIQKSVCENLNEISLKERNIEDRSYELNVIQASIERQAKELYSKVEKVEMREQELNNMLITIEERCKELDKIAQELDCAQKLLEEKSEKLSSKEKQLYSVQKYIQKSFTDFRARNRQLKIVEGLLEKRLEDQSNFFDRKAKQLEEQFIKFESKQKQLEERCRGLESKEKQIEEQSKEIVLEGKELDNVVNFHVKGGQVEDLRALNLPTEVGSLDGRNLQFYLNENFKDHESSSSEVCQILGLSSNPPKLVLDAMEGFYPPHMMKEDVEFKTSVVRRSCILLLEQLMRLSPRIRPNVKIRALTLAGEWKVKMEVFPRNPLEVLAFILLLASYKLASNFDGDEILQLLKFVKRNEVPDLCRLLGLQEKVPDFIRRLVERGLHLEAIEYVLAFNIGEEFPPGTLLDGYISYEEETAGKILEEGLYCVEAREIACRKELNALGAVMSFIMLHKFESLYPIETIKVRIEQLENRRIHLQTLASYSSPKARLGERSDSQTEERDVKKHRVLPPKHPQHLSSISYLQSPLCLTAQRREYCLAISTPVHPHMNQYPLGIFGCDNFASPSNYDARSYSKSEMHYQPLNWSRPR